MSNDIHEDKTMNNETKSAAVRKVTGAFGYAFCVIWW